MGPPGLCTEERSRTVLECFIEEGEEMVSGPEGQCGWENGLFVVVTGENGVAERKEEKDTKQEAPTHRGRKGIGHGTRMGKEAGRRAVEVGGGVTKAVRT